MVQALLQDRKSQTRRTKGLNYINENPDNWTIEYLDSIWAHGKDFEIKELKPIYEIGDILWVRETFSLGTLENGIHSGFRYKADNPEFNVIWKPSLFMPKEAARLFLKVTNVRVERLQDITEVDAIAEGITPLKMSASQLIIEKQKFFDYSKPKQLFSDGLPPFWSFNSLWCSINGSESWESNPWVWVIEFEKVEKPENF